MSYFTKDFIAFFKELSQNNNKAWFDENRKRYENSVKKPFAEFIQELIHRVRTDDPSVDIAPKDAIMRINRDIRFSKDKTPYNARAAAIISPGGKKNKTIPGSFIQLNAEEIRIYGGAHMLETDQLYKIRQAIADDPKAFTKAINAKTFKEKFGEIHGEQHKRLPEEFRATAEKQPLIANKQFYYYVTLPSKQITDDALPDLFMEYYRAGKPLNQFFRKAMGV